MVTQLTSSWDGESDTFWMPSTNATNLTDTSVGFALKDLSVPSLGDSGESFTLGNTEDIDHFVLFEELWDFNFFFKETLGEVELLINVLATIDLDFEDVSLLLSEVEFVHLGVGNDTDNLAVFLNTVEAGFNVVISLLSEEFDVFGEAFLLSGHPVLVETSLDFLAQVLSPDSGQSAETTWGFDVTDNTDNSHWWGFNDGDWLGDLFSVELSSLTFDDTGNVGHTSLEAHECGEMGLDGGAVTWEGSDATSVMFGSFTWKESQ